ncbi:FAD-dependent oxidoreductase [Roseomonas alkaliterrae]|uniref:D-amino-acid dehydrogenase n=1 Tax=Neoroseomonas alkaliterrae TaxID=1452450 RepID=A0A840Y032_9PROT|nr:FAD-dependent oxidoreductase [Neoroseomonas alkaliterrae]MBB5689777.1 D-amino-acid dehydrogenase [Neoroseomonas alkaliterrae]MBR0674921.1 FAD-dependent oxidoreductase [Neoroseomonas alkaliterrae]
MESAANEPRVIVIGGGIVGLCVAWHLARRGLRPLVLEAWRAHAAYTGNAGAISHGSVAPLAMPGVLRQVPKMLTDREGALHIPARYWLKAMPWLLRFVASARPAQVEAAAGAMASLLFGALERHREILAAEGALDLIREQGQLYVYRSAEQMAKDEPALALRRRHGQRMEVLDRAALAALEPEIAPAYQAGLFLPDHGSSVNPARFARVVAEGVRRMGGEIREAEVRAITTEGRRVIGVATDAGDLPADRVVLAAGAWSARLLAPLGIRVPLETQRGYHVMLPDAGVRLSRVVSPYDRKVFITPMEEGLRVAGTVEFGGLDAPPNEARALLLLKDLRQVFPHARTEGFTTWMGHRPCLPDSLPVMGPVKAWKGLWCAFGHGHLGLTGAAPTGALVAAAMAGEKPNFDFAPFAAERF